MTLDLGKPGEMRIPHPRKCNAAEPAEMTDISGFVASRSSEPVPVVVGRDRLATSSGREMVVASAKAGREHALL